jgi:hypothetical protein
MSRRLFQKESKSLLGQQLAARCARLQRRGGVEEFFDVLAHARAKRGALEEIAFVRDDLHGPLGEELLQVGAKARPPRFLGHG